MSLTQLLITIVLIILAGFGVRNIYGYILKWSFKSHIPHHKYIMTVTKVNGQKLPTNEPLYLFRAQDKYAADVLRYYASRLTQDKGKDYIVSKDALQWSREFDRWPVKKVPD